MKSSLLELRSSFTVKRSVLWGNIVVRGRPEIGGNSTGSDGILSVTPGRVFTKGSGQLYTEQSAMRTTSQLI